MLAHSVQSFIDHWQELDRTHKLDTSLSISHFYLSTHEPIFHTTARHSFILIALFFSLISMYLLSVDIFVIVFLNLFHSFYTCWCMKPFRSYISSRLCQFIAVTTSVATLRRLGTCIYKRGLHQRSLRESFKCASCRCVHGPDPETARSPSRWLACGSNRRQTQTGEEDSSELVSGSNSLTNTGSQQDRWKSRVTIGIVSRTHQLLHDQDDRVHSLRVFYFDNADESQKIHKKIKFRDIEVIKQFGRDSSWSDTNILAISSVSCTDSKIKSSLNVFHERQLARQLEYIRTRSIADRLFFQYQPDPLSLFG